MMLNKIKRGRKLRHHDINIFRFFELWYLSPFRQGPFKPSKHLTLFLLFPPLGTAAANAKTDKGHKKTKSNGKIPDN
jgi:hypothetical protein